MEVKKNSKLWTQVHMPMAVFVCLFVCLFACISKFKSVWQHSLHISPTSHAQIVFCECGTRHSVHVCLLKWEKCEFLFCFVEDLARNKVWLLQVYLKLKLLFCYFTWDMPPDFPPDWTQAKHIFVEPFLACTS